MNISRVEPRWLTPEVATAINLAEVTASAEPHSILDAGKLDGALNRPVMRYLYEYEGDMATLAVSLLFAIARSHAFLQGNKRTGWTGFLVFLELNGYTFTGPDSEGLGKLVVDVIDGHYREDQFTEIVRPYIAVI